MGGPSGLRKLLRRLAGHRPIALHDPGWDLLIPLPGGVLYHNAVFCPGRFRRRQTHTVVIVDRFDGDLRALSGDIVKAALGGAFGHMDDGLLAQTLRRPGHAPAVIAVGGGEERGLTKGALEVLAGEIVIGHFGHIPAQLTGDVPGHGKGAAQDLEGVQAEPVGLVLEPDAPQPQAFGQLVQLGQRGHRVLRE